MDVFAADPFSAGVSQVNLDLYTAAYRISGYMSTRFPRVSDLLNQVTTTHLLVEQATISEFAGSYRHAWARARSTSRWTRSCSAWRPSQGTARPEMRIPKRPVKAQIGIPPFRVTGTIHVPLGAGPADGLLNAADRFVTMTEAAIASALVPGGRALPWRPWRYSVAWRTSLLVADDERPDELLAEILDERTAKDWLAAREARSDGGEGPGPRVSSALDAGISRRGEVSPGWLAAIGPYHRDRREVSITDSAKAMTRSALSRWTRPMPLAHHGTLSVVITSASGSSSTRWLAGRGKPRPARWAGSRSRPHCAQVTTAPRAAAPSKVGLVVHGIQPRRLPRSNSQP